MSDVIINVEGLGKKYSISHRSEGGYLTLRDTVAGGARRVGARLSSSLGLSAGGRAVTAEDFWALRDVSFEIREGEVVGIIGRNGAGKSTLLKILSRITEPTSGRARIRGRLASLLEVGTGFHPELTGRENIFLNGSILGMPRAEIRRKFDEIVAFAEVEKFLDTPVKRYSSGMYVRLAFAVAAHLEPDLLVVDEVLAVGDAEFQRKCLGKMGDVSKQGRTVLFVSHNMGATAALCTRALLFKRGRLVAEGETAAVITKYLEDAGAGGRKTLDELTHLGNGKARVAEITFRREGGAVSNSFRSGEACSITLRCESDYDLSGVSYAIGLYDYAGRQLALLDSATLDKFFPVVRGPNQISCFLPSLPFMAGRYHVNVAISRGQELLDGIARCAEIQVEHGDFFGTGKTPAYGPFLIRHEWGESAAAESIAATA